ncbi:MAG: SH3 domain-containing protein [Chloroflexi bacterium]|nr:SH3 domain-containing protein [Chloroflexota bacterium]
MNHKKKLYAWVVTPTEHPVNFLLLLATAGLITLLAMPIQPSFADASNPATPTAVVINAVTGAGGATIWSKDGAAIQILKPGANLIVTSRSTDSQWLYVQTDDGATGWTATNSVIAANVAGLSAQSITLTPITPTAAPTVAPTATTAAPTKVPAGATPATTQAAATIVTSQSAPAGTTNGLTLQVATTGTALNVRGGPGTNYPVVGRAQPGETLVALGRNAAADWVQIQTQATAYGFGWVAARLVVASATLTDLPVATSVIDAPKSDTSAVPAQSAAQPAANQPVATSTGPTGLSGKLVIQESWGGSIYLYDLSTGNLRLLTGGFDPALSPDGSKIVFTRISSENGVYIINSDGTDEHKIFSGRQGLFSPKWSPDGQWIVFVRTDSFWECRDQSEDYGRYHCEPDAPGLITYDLIKEYRPQIARIDINGGNYRDVAALDTVSAPDWNSAGIVYSSAAGIQATTDKVQDANRKIAFDEFKKYYMDPDWQPGGGRIIFQRRDASRWDLYGVNPDGSGFAAFTRPATALVDSQPSNVSAAWSPDGQHIVFLSNRTPTNEAGSWGVWVMNADGSNQHPLPIKLAFEYNYVAEQMLDWGP